MALTIHRATLFTMTGDPTYSEDLPHFRDSYRYYEDGGIVVDSETGTIIGAGTWDELRPHRDSGAVIIDHRPHWVMPAFVDVHTHLPQWPVAARSGLNLHDWLKRYIFPTEAQFSDEALARKIARSFFQRLAAVGTTTAVVMTTIHQKATHVAFEEAQQAGLRVFMGKMLMDTHAPEDLMEPLEKGLAESHELFDAWHGKNRGLLNYVYCPRFAITCSKKLLELCGEAARARRTAVHTHINETLAEVASVKQIHPWAKTYTDVYLKTGLIAANHLNILAHQIHPSKEELDALLGFPLCTAHCPTANSALRSGEFDMLLHYSAGLDRIGLGSDVGAGVSLSLFDVMRGAGQIAQNDLHVFQLYYLATLGGARSLGVYSGALAEGREADFVVVDPQAVNPCAERPLEGLEETLLVMMNRGSEYARGLIVETYVRGARVFRFDNARAQG